MFITGASGSGTTTLGRALAAHYGCHHHDTDDFYWLPTDPPYEHKRPMPERLSLLEETLNHASSWVLSGSLDPWGDPLIPLFDLTVFLYVPPDKRMERLRQRERCRYHPLVMAAGGALHEKSRQFLEWAAAYDLGDRPGRSLQRHTAWLAQLPCPVVRIEGDWPVERLTKYVVEQTCQLL